MAGFDVMDMAKKAQKNTIVKNKEYIDDERLSNNEKKRVLKEIFQQNIRETQLKKLVRQFLPIMRDGFINHTLIYGPTGSGKTMSLQYILNEFKTLCRKEKIELDYTYIDFSTPKSEFQSFNEVGMAVDKKIKHYVRGGNMGQIQHLLLEALQKKKGYHVLVIDEIDNINPNPSKLITYLCKTIPRQLSCRLTCVFITNKPNWDNNLDPRILSFLKKDDILFESYNAIDLQKILHIRAEKALYPDTVQDGVIEKIAAYSSRDNGDARKAVELFAKAINIAEFEEGKVILDHVDQAEEGLEFDKCNMLIVSLPHHQQICLLSIYRQLSNPKTKDDILYTGMSYDYYKTVCQSLGINPVTNRRHQDFISIFDLYGLVQTKIINKGRYGQMKQIKESLDPKIVIKILERKLLY